MFATHRGNEFTSLARTATGVPSVLLFIEDFYTPLSRSSYFPLTTGVILHANLSPSEHRTEKRKIVELNDYLIEQSIRREADLVRPIHKSALGRGSIIRARLHGREPGRQREKIVTVDQPAVDINKAEGGERRTQEQRRRRWNEKATRAASIFQNNETRAGHEEAISVCAVSGKK